MDMNNNYTYVYSKIRKMIATEKKRKKTTGRCDVTDFVVT